MKGQIRQLDSKPFNECGRLLCSVSQPATVNGACCSAQPAVHRLCSVPRTGGLLLAARSVPQMRGAPVALWEPELLGLRRISLVCGGLRCRSPEQPAFLHRVWSHHRTQAAHAAVAWRPPTSCIRAASHPGPFSWPSWRSTICRTCRADDGISIRAINSDQKGDNVTTASGAAAYVAGLRFSGMTVSCAGTADEASSPV